MRLLMALLLGVLVLVGCDKTDKGENQEPVPAPINHAESLVRAVEQLHSGMKAESKEEKVAALKRILPTRADLEVLFPGHGEKLWAMIQPYLEQMVESIDQVAAELTKHEWTEIEPTDVRQKDDSDIYIEVLSVIPKEIPIFSIVKRSKESVAGSSSYLFINNRWVFIRGLPAMPEIIADNSKDRE